MRWDFSQSLCPLTPPLPPGPPCAGPLLTAPLGLPHLQLLHRLPPPLHHHPHLHQTGAGGGAGPASPGATKALTPTVAQTLLHVPAMTWLVVEDAAAVSPRLERILARCNGMDVVVLVQSKPSTFWLMPAMLPLRPTPPCTQPLPSHRQVPDHHQGCHGG